MSLFLLIFFPLMGGVVALCRSGVLTRGRAEELEGSSLLVLYQRTQAQQTVDGQELVMLYIH